MTAQRSLRQRLLASPCTAKSTTNTASRSRYRASRERLRRRALLIIAMLCLPGSLLAQDPILDDTRGSVRRAYVSVGEQQIHVRYAAPDDAQRHRPPLALFHLSPNSSQVFSSVLPLLASDRLVIAPDTPGYGMSDALPDPQRIGAYASALVQALDRLVGDASMDAVGYHTGAGIALEIDRQFPGRLRRIALVAVPVLTREERQRGAAIPMISFDEDGEWAKSEWQRSWQWRGPQQDRESVLATFAAKMRPGARERGARAILAYDTGEALQQASAELLIVRVKDDLWEASARARALRPDAQYRELADYGHGLFHAAPDMMNALLREFLDAGPSTSTPVTTPEEKR